MIRYRIHKVAGGGLEPWRIDRSDQILGWVQIASCRRFESARLLVVARVDALATVTA